MVAIDAETGASARATKSVANKAVEAGNQHEVFDERQNTAAIPKRRVNVVTVTAAASENADADAAVRENRTSDLTAIEIQLEKQLRILQLKAEINKLEAGKACRSIPINFSEIEKTFRTFNGDDKGDIGRWISEFEDSAKAYGYDEEAKFLIARRLLTGSAQILLHIGNIDGWNKLKQQLMDEFKRPLSVKDIFRQLETRVWEKSESLTHYVLSMQELAQSAPIEEYEFLEFIIDGLKDKSAKALIFSGVTTIEKFKKLIPQYERLRAATEKKVSAPNSIGDMSAVRCYNCSRYGHYSKDCAEKRRAPGSCFKCGAKEHQYRTAPSRL
ncbi:PREDICTED: uncharacterized protein LOC108365711 [Rhagoletis zephyria]|uniref:uncharacterized protein LOC108365711 n=1 Tax=Rhagoletis zephyria TaxID=28612 RepID=UPI00081140F9|nr:PREDICTED: uncharacterized protein LOC108365711 [Rhagoletis zephyria]